jgi:hypothetical protein
VVALSGTPVINRANEIAFLMNLLRGPIERVVIPFNLFPRGTKKEIATAFRNLPDVGYDRVQYGKEICAVTQSSTIPKRIQR